METECMIIYFLPKIKIKVEKTFLHYNGIKKLKWGAGYPYECGLSLHKTVYSRNHLSTLFSDCL